MDEISLLRRSRIDIPERAPEDIARGRTALFDAIDSEAPVGQIASQGHETQSSAALRRRAVRPRWAAPALAVALITIVVCITVPAAISVGGGSGAPAASVPSATTRSEEPLVVTAEMYEAAYAQLKQCMRDHGTGLAAEYMEGVVHAYSYLAVDESVYAVCYPDFEQIDRAWQIAHSYDSPTYVALRKCLTDIGVTPASDAEGVYQQILDNGIDPTTCRPPAFNPYSQPQE